VERTFRAGVLAAAGVVAAATALLIGPSPGDARRLSVPTMGVQFHGTWSSYTAAQRAAVLDRFQAAGVRWVRIDLGWPSFQETGRGAFSRWYVSLADDAVNEARARGLEVLATLWGTPRWANGGGTASVPPANAADYAQAAQWLAAHFRGRVSAWEVWNEPNLSDFWQGSVAQYASLLKAAYPAFKSGDPSARVVLGGPSTNDADWLRKLYAAGAKGTFDVMSTHPYMGVADAPPEARDDGTRYTIAHVRAVHRLMVRNGDGAKPIWFTEFGWSSHANWPGVENWNRGVTPQRQGEYLVRTLKYVGANFRYVTNVFWYTDRNESGAGPHNDNYGLLMQDGSPKPAYDALKAFLAG
jgi:hypothetical protein